MLLLLLDVGVVDLTTRLLMEWNTSEDHCISMGLSVFHMKYICQSLHVFGLPMESVTVVVP